MKNLVNPLYTDEETIEMLVGCVEFRDEVIDNLRQQILNLRKLALDHNIGDIMVDHYQFKHIPSSSK